MLGFESRRMPIDGFSEKKKMSCQVLYNDIRQNKEKKIASHYSYVSKS